MIWREKRIPLAILGVLLLANIVFFFTYRVQYQNRLQDLDVRLRASQDRLTQAQRMRETAQQQFDGYRKVQQDLQTLYNQRWSTQTARFTSLIVEVKRLVVASHLVLPRSSAFSHADAHTSKETGMIDTAVVGISFTVQGSYEQVRRLINLLELSDQFVIIDGISLAGGNDKILTLNLRLKTLFREPVQQPGPAFGFTEPARAPARNQKL